MRWFSDVLERFGMVARRRRAAANQSPSRRIDRRLGWRLEQLEERTLLSIGGADPYSFFAPQRIEPLDVSVGPYVEGQGFWVDFDVNDGLDLGTEASMELISSSQSEVVGQVSVPGAWVRSVALGDMGFTQMTIPGCGYTNVVGQPQLPVVRSLLAVPKGAEVTAQMVGQPQLLSMVDVAIDEQLAPLQAPVPKLPGEIEAAPLDFNQAIYETDAFLPDTGIRAIEAGYVAGQRLVMLEILPISYNPVTQAISVYDTLNFDVRFEGGESAAPVLSAADDARLAELVLNHTVAEDPKASGRLLIIAHDDFVADMAAFVTHKTGLGWTVDLIGTSTAGTTNTEIRSYIQSRYDNVATRPDALLLVGDTDRIPHFVGSGDGSPDTDLYYACMDSGDDWYQEFPVGRLSVANSTQLADVIEKTIAYEVSSAGLWTSHATFMAGVDNYEITEGTHNYVIDTYMDPLSYTSDKLYRVTYDATTQDVRDSFNGGTALGVYSGHGSEYSWADGPPFLQADVTDLTNYQMYPLVSSFACLTGKYTASECFMETWLRAADKAAVVAVGSSVNSFWTEDDILEKRLFDAIYAEKYVAFGSAWMRAKELYLQHFGVSDMTRRYFEMYNVLGDPTLEVLGLEFRIRSPSDLPMAYLGEPYEYTLAAIHGTEPYTWSVIAGTLPAGLSLDSATGLISGNPTTLGAATFTIEATDATLATDSREFHLPVVDRLQITTPAQLPTAALDVPYSVTLEAEGGSTPYSWLMLGAGQYAESDPGPGYLGGGTAMGWRADDASWELALPWSFAFYDTAYNSVYVCSNGFLDFASSSSEFTNSQAELLSNVRIAPLWDDLVTSGLGENIYVTQTVDYVAIRWKGHTWSSSYPVDFEAVLYRDGQIQFNYGAAHFALSPTIGVSMGNGTHYTLSVRDGASSIPANESSLFTHEGLLPTGLSFDGATGEISGTPTEEGVFDLTFRVEDAGTPVQTDVKDFTLEVWDLPPLTVSLPQAATEGDGLLVDQGAVSVPTAVTGNLLVALESDDTSEVTLPPPTVVILDGQTSATFDLKIEDDTILDGTQRATITASATGYDEGSAGMDVHDNETATLSVVLPASAGEEDGVLSDAGSVTISGGVPGSNVVVSLISDDTTEVIVPPTVEIPAGQTSATFDVTIANDTEIDGTQTATVTAQVANWTGGSDTIDVLDDDGHLTVVLPAKLWEGDGILTDAGTVILGGTLPYAVDVSLDPNDTSELMVPAVVSIPAGETSWPFDLTVEDDADCDGSQPVLVTASASGLTSGSDTTDVGDNDVHHFGIGEIAKPQTASTPFTVTLTAKDVNGEIIEVHSGTADLTGAGDSGPVPIELDAGIVFVDGQWAGQIAVHAVDTNVVLTADDGQGQTGTSNAFDVVPGPLDHFAWDTIALVQYRDVPFSTTLTALDANNYTVTDFNDSVDLGGWLETATIVISEVNPHSDDAVEFTNVSDADVDVSGWRIVIYDDLTWPQPKFTLNIPNDTVSAPADTFVLTEFGTSPGTYPNFWTGGDIYWDGTSEIAVLLLNAAGQPVDFMCGTTAQPSQITTPISIPPEQWHGDPIPGYPASPSTYHRAGDADYNDSSDWQPEPNSIGTLNPNLTVPFTGGASPVPITPMTTGAFIEGVWTGDVTVLEEASGMYLRAEDDSGCLGDSDPFYVELPLPSDFGDAPDSTSAAGYPTLSVNNGARHYLGGPFMGVAADEESDGQPTALADGDDLDNADDEDGVTIHPLVARGEPATVDVDMTNSPADGYLDAWVDFNGDGDWAEPGEQIFTDSLLTAGLVHQLSFAVPVTATRGPTYARFRVSSTGGLSYYGRAADGEVEDYQVEIPEDVRIDVTEGDDTIELNTDGSVHQIDINGAVYVIDDSSKLHIYGLDGNDTIRMYLSASAEKAYLDVGTVRVDGLPSYQVQADSVEVVRVYGGGNDEAYFTGSAGDDTFTSYETHSYLQASGIFNYVVGFAYVEADLSDTGGGGTNDRAYLYDSAAAADDTFYGYPDYGLMDRAGTTPDAKAAGFDIIKGLATGGGTKDKAYLYGSDGEERLYSYETYSYVNYANLQNYVGGFDDVEIDVTSDGLTSTDRAWMFDSDAAVNDTFYGDPGESRMVFNTGNENKAIGFDVIRAYATGGSNDRAYLTGSAESDRFLSYETHGYLYGPGYWNLARGFDYVEADATTGSEVSYDRAWLFDSSGRDEVYATPTSASIDRDPTGMDNGKAIMFDIVRAYATGGGTDEILLWGSDGNDELYSCETYSYLKGADFYNLALRFDNVLAFGQGGSGDRAYLYDSDGAVDDELTAGPTSAKMDRGGTAADVETISFEVVRAYARGGGYDVAYLNGSSDDDRLYGYEEYTYMQGPGYYNYAERFDSVEADGLGHVGGDRADLYDSQLAASDTFTGHSTPGALGTMEYAGGNTTAALNFEFDYARAPVDYPDTDTADLHLGTLWHEIGDWETVTKPGPGSPGSSQLDLDVARWLAALEQAKTASNDDGDTGEVDLEVVDWLFSQD